MRRHRGDASRNKESAGLSSATFAGKRGGCRASPRVPRAPSSPEGVAPALLLTLCVRLRVWLVIYGARWKLQSDPRVYKTGDKSFCHKQAQSSYALSTWCDMKNRVRRALSSNNLFRIYPKKSNNAERNLSTLCIICFILFVNIT